MWVDTVWDLDFTETEPLESWIAEEITADGLNTFTRLYHTLAPFAAEDQDSTEVTSPEHRASHSHFSFSPLSCLEIRKIFKQFLFCLLECFRRKLFPNFNNII